MVVRGSIEDHVGSLSLSQGAFFVEASIRVKRVAERVVARDRRFDEIHRRHIPSPKSGRRLSERRAQDPLGGGHGHYR